jgi:hypothetical protein
MTTTGCSAAPVNASDVKRYTGVRLCDAATVRDRTTPEERDTTPGFSFHVVLRMPAACQRDFEAQLAEIAGAECPNWPHAQRACLILDASKRGSTKKHTTVNATALGGGLYDLRFYE